MPRVALVFPYFRTRSATEMLFAPLGIASLAAQLRQRDIETGVFDCTFQTFSRVAEKLLDYQPDIVGVSSMILLNRSTFRFAELLRQRLPEALLVAGGPMPTLYPENFLGSFDLVFRGEADLSFPRFCQDYFSHGVNWKTLYRLDLASYPGLNGHTLDLFIQNPIVHYSQHAVRKFPIPDRSDFDHKSYQQDWMRKNGSRTASLMVTFGCPFDCDFCSRPGFGHLYRKRNLEVVFEEINQLRQLGYDRLWIADDNFTLDLSFLFQFCQRIEKLGIGWSCLSRSTGITQEIAMQMKTAGCTRVYLGLESGSDETLRLMNKKATLEDGIRAVEHFHQAGIQVAAFFIVGYPGESREAVEKTFSLALSLPLDEISFNVPFPLPGSALFTRVSGIDPTKDWSRENDVTFVYQSEFDPSWLKHCIQQTMHAFNHRNMPSSGSRKKSSPHVAQQPIRRNLE
ncbi:MAG: B12-binding domain-containing radical SAM protein [Anaerolineae bacterium]|nr:B12-binding domain-containing radical SAM protein [Anaerolineae bacterium]